MAEVAAATAVDEAVAVVAIGAAGTNRCGRGTRGQLAWTDKLINRKDTHGKESKHHRETSSGNGKEEKSRGKEGAAPQIEGTIGRANCAGHAFGGRQLTWTVAAPLITEGNL